MQSSVTPPLWCGHMGGQNRQQVGALSAWCFGGILFIKLPISNIGKSRYMNSLNVYDFLQYNISVPKTLDIRFLQILLKTFYFETKELQNQQELYA